MPRSFVTAVSFVPVCSEATTTVTPGKTPPPVSVTTPESVERVPCA